MAEYDHIAQNTIANQIEEMTERPSNDMLLEGIQKSEGMAETFQEWIEKFCDTAETGTDEIPEADETVKAKAQESQSLSFADTVSQPGPEEMQTETESDTIDYEEEYHFELYEPEKFEEFLAHSNWIDEYVRGLKSQERIELIMFVRSQLEVPPTIFEIALKELRAGQENENAGYKHEQLEFVPNM